MDAENTSSMLPAGSERRVLQGKDDSDVLCLEAPLVLRAADGQILTMRTPTGLQHDREWALGFLASEGALQDISEIKHIEHKCESEANRSYDVVEVDFWRSGSIDRLGVLSRSHEIRPSCGICGVDDVASIAQGLASLTPGEPATDSTGVVHAIQSLRANMPLFAATGGCHGCAILSGSGELWVVREDVGRHNALDKAIGACLEQGRYLGESIAVLSGRAGYELVIKALRVGIPIIVSIGAASAFSVAIAQAAGATLIGFVDERGGRIHRGHIYADEQRFHGLLNTDSEPEKS